MYYFFMGRSAHASLRAVGREARVRRIIIMPKPRPPEQGITICPDTWRLNRSQHKCVLRLEVRTIAPVDLIETACAAVSGRW